MKVLLLIFQLLLCSILLSMAAPAVTLPAHPRLLLVAKDIPEIKSRMNHPDYADVKKAFENQLVYETAGKSENGAPDEKIRQKMEAKAFLFLIDPKKNKSFGYEAIKIARSYLPSINKVKGYKENLDCYEAVFGTAMVYDWCYQLLTDEDKRELNAQMKRVCCLAEYCLDRGTPKQYLSGHYGEVGAGVFLAMGIALYDEDKTYFHFEYPEQINQFAASRNPMYEAGTHHQGSQYIAVRYFSEILQAFLLEKLGLNPYSKKISNVAFRGIYQSVPQATDMDGMPDGDCHNGLGMGYFPYLNLAAQFSKNPFLQSAAIQYLKKSASFSTRAFIYHDSAVQSKTIDSLKLSHYFPSPSGIMIARTGWDYDKKSYDSNDMVVFMNMREYSAKNHQHLDNGHFSIYYKGHLALDAGIYQGRDAGNEWGKINYVNYYARTVAHNSVLIYDPNEPYPFEGWDKRAEARDGGQFSFKNHAWDTSAEMFEAGKSAQVQAHDIASGLAPDYTYLKGDMTRAYNCPPNVDVYPAKADTVRRSFVFLNLKNEKHPGALIVMDKIVSTNASFQKKWLLHSQNEPVISKNTVEFQNTNNGRNGKLHNDVLLPETGNQKIEKIGGPGKEYWVDGKNWGSVTQEDAGCWRIELSPVKASLSDNFLNVIQVMDASPAQNPIVVNKSMATKGNYVAVEIADRIVAQQLALGKNDQTIEFSIGKKDLNYKVLVTDLKQGNWIISTSSGDKKISVIDSAGTAYFNSIGGKITLTREEKPLAKSECKSCIIIKNPLSVSRENEIISINRNDLHQPTENLFPVIRKKSEILTTQVSDSNGDGKWDQLLIEVSMKPVQTDTLSISWVSSEKLPVFPKNTNVRFSYRSNTTEPTAEILKLSHGRGFTQDISKPVFQMEGPGIENDKVAFRHFFDARNGKDLYGKLTSEMVLDKVGLTGTWHKLQDWGMDILHTGGSIGAGGLAVRENGILYPLADADSTIFRQVEEGPLNATYLLNFKNWDCGTSKMNGSEKVSMREGDFFFQEKVKVPLLNSQKLLCGMPNFSSDSLSFTNHNNQFSSISSFDKQADGTNTLLGLAVMFPTKSYSEKGKTSKTDKYINSDYVELKTATDNTLDFLFFACWEKTNSRFSTKKGFDEYLQLVADKQAYPILISVK